MGIKEKANEFVNEMALESVIEAMVDGVVISSLTGTTRARKKTNIKEVKK